MFGYIKTTQSFLLTLGNIFVRRRDPLLVYPWFKYSPSQCVIWLGSWLLHVTRYITRQ